MSTLTGLIGGGGGGGKVFYRTFIFESSGTYTPSADCEVFVYVIGAGGSGAAYSGVSSDQHCSGGGAGGLCASIFNVTSGVNYTATIGTGGAGKSGVGGFNGSAGGSSSFSGTGITTMTANGGQGGEYTSGAGSSTGALGGSASGGNLFNYTGGGSGDVTSGSSARASGGGSVNLFNNVNSVTSNTANNTNNTTPAKDPFSGTQLPNYYRLGAVADAILFPISGAQQGEAFWGTDGDSGSGSSTALYGGGSGGFKNTSGASGSGGNGLILVLELR